MIDAKVVVGMLYDITVELAHSRTYGIPYDWIEERWDIDLSDKQIQSDIREAWYSGNHIDLISDMDFDNTNKKVYVMIWETGRGNEEMQKYTLKDYKQFCEEALIMPPFEDDEQIDEWFHIHKIQIIANGCVMELDYDADVVNELEFGLKEIHEAILGSGEATTGNMVGSQYRQAELKDIVRWFIMEHHKNDDYSNWFDYVKKAVEELTDVQLVIGLYEEARNLEKYIDFKCNWQNFKVESLKDATKEGIKKIILDLVGSDLEISYDPHTDKSFIIDYTFKESGDFIDWSWGQINEDEKNTLLKDYKARIFEN